ncbi:MAG: choice-of-anchor D domain-containing protein [Thermodesulfobacteriota bacterium]
MMRAVAIFLALLGLLAGQPAGAALRWEAIGPEGGDQFAIGISPHDPSLLFVTGHHGVFRSRDGGESWQAVHHHAMADGSFLGLAFSPADPGVVLVANDSTGVWRSTDQGETWEARNSGLPLSPGSLSRVGPVVALARAGDGSLYAGLAARSMEDPLPAWVFRSSDDGLTWQPDGTGIEAPAGDLSQWPAVLFNVDAQGRVWAMLHGSGVFVRQEDVWVNRNGDLPPQATRATFLAGDPTDADRLFLGTEDDWVYGSADGGATWSRLALPAELAEATPLPLVYTLAIDPNNAQLLWVVANDSAGSLEQPLFRPGSSQHTGGGSYLSADGGQTWLATPAGAFRVAVDATATRTDSFSGLLSTPMTRSSRWYKTAGGRVNVLRSLDGLRSFQAITNGIYGLLVNGVTVLPAAAGAPRLVAVAESGLYGGDGSELGWQWASSAGTPVYTWSLIGDPADSGKLLFATGNPAWATPEVRGVWRLDRDCFGGPCSERAQILSGVGVWRLIPVPDQPERLYAATQEQGILASADGGQTWDPFNEGLGEAASISDLELDGTGQPLFAGSRRSHGDPQADQPENWRATPDETGAVWRFDAEAGVWQPCEGIGAAVLDLEWLPGTGVLYAATAAGLYRSPDQGATWEPLLAGVVVFDLLLDPARPDYLHVATRAGVLRSTDRGSHWHPLADGLTTDTVYGLALDPDTGILYAASGGNSVFRLVPDPAPVPEASFAPAWLDFGERPVGLPAAASVEIQNSGEADLVIQGIEVSQTAFAAGELALPATITPGNRLAIPVQFLPPAEGPWEGELRLATNIVQEEPVTYRLTGSGRPAVAPDLTLTANGLAPELTVARGMTVSLAMTIAANDYLGREMELWLRWQAPGNTYWMEPSQGWQIVAAGVPFLVGPLLSGSRGVGRPPLVAGTHVWTLFVDQEVNGTLDPGWQTEVTVVVTPDPPVTILYPAALDLGEVPVGRVVEAQLWIVNPAQVPLVIGDIRAGATSLSLPGLVLPITVNPKSGAPVTVRFQADVLGTMTSELTLLSPDSRVADAVCPVQALVREAIPPRPEVLANNQGGTVPVAARTRTKVTIGLAAADTAGETAEWWLRLLVVASGDTLWLTGDRGWVASPTPLPIGVFPMADLPRPLPVLNVKLPRGEYRLSLSLDPEADGVPGETWMDEVVVQVE